MTTSWACPNDPPCPHLGLIHDVYDLDDPYPTCCAEGCKCGHPGTAILERRMDGTVNVAHARVQVQLHRQRVPVPLRPRRGRARRCHLRPDQGGVVCDVSTVASRGPRRSAPASKAGSESTAPSIPCGRCGADLAVRWFNATPIDATEPQYMPGDMTCPTAGCDAGGQYYHSLFCPTGWGCVCACPNCVTHCGPADREAARFCVTQGIKPEPRAVRAARMLLDEREAPCVT